MTEAGGVFSNASDVPLNDLPLVNLYLNTENNKKNGLFMLGVILGWNVFPPGCACERGRKQSSLTLNGETGYEPGCQFHALSRESVFSFLAVQCNSFFF